MFSNVELVLETTIVCVLHNIIMMLSLSLQSELVFDFEQDVAKTTAYLGLVTCSGNLQIFLVVERILLCSVESFSEALWALVSSYYTFDLMNPKNFEAVLKRCSSLYNIL